MSSASIIEPECDEEGCTSHFTVGCYLPDTDRTSRPDNFYCSEHAEQNGFCKSCGDFWGGVESFEFGEYHGYCDLCAYQLEAEDDENDYDNDWDWPDEWVDYAAAKQD